MGPGLAGCSNFWLETNFQSSLVSSFNLII
jgi:hypothetical protein